MYLLSYPASSLPSRIKAVRRHPRPVATEGNFITPDGLIVPRALGEAALLDHTAVLVGGLLAGFWPQS